MKKRDYLILVGGGVLLFNSPLNADNFKLLFLQGGDNTTGADLEYELHLNSSRKWRAGVKYYSNESSVIKDFILTDREGKKATELDEKDVSAYLMYDFLYNISLGVEYQEFKSNKEQWGYSKENSKYVSYDHFIDIKGSRTSIKGLIYYIGDKFSSEVRATVTPETRIDIDQNTEIYSNSNLHGKLSTTSTLDLSYNIKAKMNWEVGKFFNISLIDLGLEAEYEFIPYNYELKVLNNNKYEIEKQEYDEKRNEYYGVITFKDDKLIRDYGVTFKYGQIKIERDGMNTEKENIFKFGIEKWF